MQFSDISFLSLSWPIHETEKKGKKWPAIKKREERLLLRPTDLSFFWKRWWNRRTTEEKKCSRNKKGPFPLLLFSPFFLSNRDFSTNRAVNPTLLICPEKCMGHRRENIKMKRYGCMLAFRMFIDYESVFKGQDANQCSQPRQVFVPDCLSPRVCGVFFSWNSNKLKAKKVSNRTSDFTKCKHGSFVP